MLGALPHALHPLHLIVHRMPCHFLDRTQDGRVVTINLCDYLPRVKLPLYICSARVTATCITLLIVVQIDTFEVCNGQLV